MLKRTLTGAALIIVLVAVLLFLPAWCTGVLLSVMVGMAANELLKTTGLVDNQRLITIAIGIAIAIPWASYFGTDYYRALIVVLAITVLFFSEMLRTHGQLPFQQVAMSLVAGLLIPFLLCALVRIRVMENGVYLIAAPFVMAFMPDTGAYLVGCAIGKTPIERTAKNMLPMYAVMVIVLLLVTYVPVISLGLPQLACLI